MVSFLSLLSVLFCRIVFVYVRGSLTRKKKKPETGVEIYCCEIIARLVCCFIVSRYFKAIRVIFFRESNVKGLE